MSEVELLGDREYDLGNFASNDISFVHGDPITKKKDKSDPNFPDPDHMHLIYMRLNTNPDDKSDNRFHVVQLSEPLAGKKRSEKEVEMITKARRGNYDTQQALFDFDVIDFRDKACFVVVYLDEEHWKFHPAEDIPQTPAIVMRRNKIVNRKEDGKPYLAEFAPNYSFYNYEKGKLKIGDSSERDIIRFTNYFKKDKWGNPEYIRKDPEKKEEQEKQNRYAFDFYIKMPYYHPNWPKPTGWLTVIFDPPTPPRG